MTLRILLFVTLAMPAIGRHCDALELNACDAVNALAKQNTGDARLQHDHQVQQIELDATDIFRKHFPGAHALVASDEELKQMSQDLQRRIDDQSKADSKSGKPRILSAESRRLHRMLGDISRVRSSRLKHSLEESMRKFKKQFQEFERMRKIQERRQKQPLKQT